MSRDALLYVADVVAAGEAIRRYTDGVTFEAFAANDEKRAAVERQVCVISEAGARCPMSGGNAGRRCPGAKLSACETSSPVAIGRSKPSIAVLLFGLRESSWRSREVPVPQCLLGRGDGHRAIPTTVGLNISCRLSSSGGKRYQDNDGFSIMGSSEDRRHYRHATPPSSIECRA